jgi:hypothetical protein
MKFYIKFSSGASNVVRTGRSVNRPKLTLYRSETPSIKTKLNTIHHAGELLKGQRSSSADQRGPPTKGQHVNFLLFFYFYFVRFLSLRPVKTARPILTIYTSNDAVSRKEVPFGDPNACKNFQGILFLQKHLNCFI